MGGPRLPNVELEPFEPSDAGRLLGWIDSEAALLAWAGPAEFRWPLDEPQLRAYAESAEPRRRLVFKAVERPSGAAVGHVELALTPGHASGRVCRVLVGPGARGRGVATAMLSRLLDRALGELGLHRVELAVYEWNVPAIACYERLGFVREGLLRETTVAQDGRWSTIVMGAKGPVTMSICGPESCASERSTDLRPSELVLTLMSVESLAVDADSSGETDAPHFASVVPPGPYYEVRFRPDWTGEAVRYVLRDPARLVAGSTWIALGAELERALQSLLVGVEPFPAPSIAAVTVNGRAARESSAYAGLYGRLESISTPSALGERVTVALRTGRATPWTGAGKELLVYPDAGVVRRADGWYRLPVALADAIAADAGPGPRGDSVPWWALGAVLGAAAALAGAALVARRRAGQAAPLRRRKRSQGTYA